MAANQPPGYPPPGGGYPPPGGGYPPPGYPPQGGAPPGYPPPYAQGPGFEPQHSRPGSVTGACVLWIIYGSLGLLGGLMTLGASGGRAGAPGFVGLGIAVAFLVSGIQVLMGKASSVLVSGIGSIVWGVFVLLAMLALGGLVRGLGGASGLFAIIGLVLGGMLITAGILACVGNAKYKAWRQTKGL